MKFKSRKFIAFAVWLVLTVVVLFVGIEDRAGVLQYFFVVTVIYIGGQSAIDALGQVKK